jgi:nucleoside 2-deoxyribosyltransferase
MASNRIKFTGWFSAETLGGIFKIFRGYADLRDLAKISMPYTYLADTHRGYQRSINEEHAKELKKFFESSIEGYKLIPEIILGLRINHEDGIVSLDSGFDSAERNWILFAGDIPEHIDSSSGERKITAGKKPTKNFGKKVEITIDIQKLASKKDAIRRVDGNHRLHFADQLQDDPNNPNKYIVPFCMIFLNKTEDRYDDYAEAMVFYNINQKGIPIESEHGLNVLLTSNLDEPQLYQKDPYLFCSKFVKEKMSGFSPSLNHLFGEHPLTNIYHLIKALKENEILKLESEAQTKHDIECLLHTIHDYYAWSSTENLKIAQSFQIIPAILLISHEKGGNEEIKYWLKHYNKWIVKNELIDQFESTKPSQLWSVFKNWKEHQPKSIFVACYFSEEQKYSAMRQMIEEAIQNIQENYHVNIEHVRIDQNRGASFELVREIFDKIDQADLVIADLTEERPNVYCEVGYAKAKGTPFILTYRPINSTDATSKNRIHSDLLPQKYVQYSEVSVLRDELIKELKGIYEIND